MDNGPTVIIEIAASQLQGRFNIIAAVWCQVTSVDAVVLVKIDARKHTTTVIKIVRLLSSGL